jgi:hypothetical protein
MKEVRDNTWGRGGGGLPTLPGLNLSTFQPSQRGSSEYIHLCEVNQRHSDVYRWAVNFSRGLQFATMTYTRPHTRPSQKDLGCVVYPLNNKSLVKDVPGPENKLIIVYPNLFYHSVFIKNAHIIHLFSFSNIGLLLFL